MGLMTATIKRFLPKSLLGRSLLIIVMPLVILQMVSAAIFYETHWDKVTLRLARGVAGDIAAVITLLRKNTEPENHDWVFNLAAQTMEFQVSFKEKTVLPNSTRTPSGLMERMLARAIRGQVGKPFQIDTDSKDRYVIIDIQLATGVLHFETTRKRLFSSTVYVFVVWMVGTSLILFAVATIFMRNQVKPIRRLAIAADNFGKGRDVSNFKPEGASEVRQAGSALLLMQARLGRQLNPLARPLNRLHILQQRKQRLVLDTQEVLPQELADAQHPRQRRQHLRLLQRRQPSRPVLLLQK